MGCAQPTGTECAPGPRPSPAAPRRVFMHICILYQHYLRPGDAGHNRFNDYARIWKGQGHRVSVITGQASYMTGMKDPSYYYRASVHEKDGDVDVYRMYVPDRANESFP